MEPQDDVIPNNSSEPKKLSSRLANESNHIMASHPDQPTLDNHHVHPVVMQQQQQQQGDSARQPPPLPYPGAGRPSTATAVVRRSSPGSLSRNGSTGTQEVCISRSSSVGSEGPGSKLTPTANHVIAMTSPASNAQRTSASSLLNAVSLETLS